jgi:hypothetical protein
MNDVLSELGLFPLSLCTIKATINYWHHLLSANANSLIYHSYQENTLRKDGLCSKIKLELLIQIWQILFVFYLEQRNHIMIQNLNFF